VVLAWCVVLGSFGPNLFDRFLFETFKFSCFFAIGIFAKNEETLNLDMYVIFHTFLAWLSQSVWNGLGLYFLGYLSVILVVVIDAKFKKTTLNVNYVLGISALSWLYSLIYIGVLLIDLFFKFLKLIVILICKVFQVKYETCGYFEDSVAEKNKKSEIEQTSSSQELI